MTKEEFRLYYHNKIERYSHVLSQNVHEEGEEESCDKAIKQLKNLLPQGNETPNHYLFNINKQDDCKIGFVWLKVEIEKKSAFLYEIYVFDEFRTQGYGTKVMNYMEKWLKDKDVHYFKLHVYGSNTGARKLYEELGFEIAGINMLKTIN